MAKVKYRYNESTLSYEKVELSLWQKLLRSFWFLAASMISGLGIYIIANVAYTSPEEQQLRVEKDELLIQYQLMDRKLDQMSTVLADLENRDDNIYRAIFEAEPIPSNIRQSGVGGVNRYKSLEKFRNEAGTVIETSKRLDSLARRLYTQSKSFDDVMEMARQKEELLASIPAIQPVANKDLRRMSSGFGLRMHPIHKIRQFHWGMDFTAVTGTEIYSTGKGTIVFASNSNNGYGNHVIVDHGYGYQTLYAHMSEVKVKKGQEIKRGEILGFVGNTGLSSAPHLHYEVIKDGNKVNPVNYYFNDLTPAEYDLMIQLASQENQSFD